MSGIAWESFDIEPVAEVIRREASGDADGLILAFQYLLAALRVDPTLLDHLLQASVSLAARARETSPRTILETLFRECPSDEAWVTRYRALLD